MKLTLLVAFALLCLLSVQAWPTGLDFTKSLNIGEDLSITKEITIGKEIGGVEKGKDKSELKKPDGLDKKPSEEECKDESEPKKVDDGKIPAKGEEECKDESVLKKLDDDKKPEKGEEECKDEPVPKKVDDKKSKNVEEECEDGLKNIYDLKDKLSIEKKLTKGGDDGCED